MEGALKKTNSGNAARFKGVVLEMLKREGKNMIEGLLRLYNVCLEKVDVFKDWKTKCGLFFCIKGRVKSVCVIIIWG